jgi:hypothetical protein
MKLEKPTGRGKGLLPLYEITNNSYMWLNRGNNYAHLPDAHFAFCNN